MEKIIEKNLSITSANRCIEKLEHEIYSHDKGTAVFKFTAEGLTASKVLCLFYFKETKRYRTVEATISENTITVPFDSTSIIADESVIGYIYFEKVEQSTDVYAFAFNVWLSAIDKARKAPLVERTSGRIVDVENIVTKQEIDALFAKIKEQGGTYDDSNLRTEIGRISTEIETLKTKTDKDTVYDDSALKQRVTALENKTDNDTVYNDAEIKQRLEVLEHKPSVNTSELVTKQELESKGYLTEHQSLEDYAKKSEIPQAYNDTEVKQRLSTIEQKGESYATKEQLASIPKNPQKLTLSGNTLILSDGGGSVNLPTSSQNAPAATTSSSEITGNGMPEGKVEGTLGQTYVDIRRTNGALKWIKRTASGKTGWAVLDGDTGWKKIQIVSGLGNSFVQIRRVNNAVYYQFGGLQWGWFGVVRRGGPGYQLQPSDRERNAFIIGLNGIPLGFRSTPSLIGQIFNDKGVPYGTWYLGGGGDGNQLRFQFTDPVPTDRDIGDIRVSQITYFTEDPWPLT